MKAQQEHKVDRTGWAPGQWDGEPDREEWTTASGLPGIIARNHDGAWCGYAAVPSGHPLHGQHYRGAGIEAHGGLTYAGQCAGHICHTPAPGEPDDVWWFGFDCSHSWDVVPGIEAQFSFERRAYRSREYVRAEVETLAEQLAALVTG